MNKLDWNELHSFYLVARHGSLSAAARAEQYSQPTMSRHISRLEESIGTRLFDRSKSGVALTEAGTELYEHAIQMADAASRLELKGQGKQESISGTVRITASRIVATFLLPDMLAGLRTAEPEIEIELVASDQSENLLHREADIALRMFRPTQPDVITRQVASLAVGAYATPDYLARKGEPTGLEDIHHHDFIGYDRSTLIIDGFHQNGIEVDRDFFCFRSDDQVACWKMVVAGFGIGFNQCVVGDCEPEVVRIMKQVEIPDMPVWLTAHQDLKSSVRIRRVYDYLGDAFTAIARQ